MPSYTWEAGEDVDRITLCDNSRATFIQTGFVVRVTSGTKPSWITLSVNRTSIDRFMVSFRYAVFMHVSPSISEGTSGSFTIDLGYVSTQGVWVSWCSDTVTWSVGPTETDPPLFPRTSYPTQVQRGTSLSFRPGNGGSSITAITYRLGSTAPSWVSVSSNGTLTGLAPNEIRTYSFDYIATNSVGSTTIRISLGVTRDPPTTPTGPTTPTVTVPTIAAQTFRIYKGITNGTVNVVTTPSTGVTLAIASTPTAPSWVSLNSSSTALLVSPPADASGDYTMGATATNANGTSAAATITLRAVDFFQQASQTFYLTGGAFFNANPLINLSDMDVNIGQFTTTTPSAPAWVRRDFTATGGPQLLGTAPAAGTEVTFTMQTVFTALSFSASIEITLITGTPTPPNWIVTGDAAITELSPGRTGTLSIPALDEPGFPPADVTISDIMGFMFDVAADHLSADATLEATVALGSYTGIVNATNASGTDTYSKPINVVTYVPPSLRPEWPTQTTRFIYNEGDTIALQLTLPTITGVVLTATGTLPTGMTFNTTTGAYSGTLGADSAGTYTHTVTATANQLSRDITITFVIIETALFSEGESPLQVLTVGQTHTYVHPDPGGTPKPTLTMYGTDDWDSYDASTRTWTATPTAADSGERVLYAAALDGTTSVFTIRWIAGVPAAPSYDDMTLPRIYIPHDTEGSAVPPLVNAGYPPPTYADSGGPTGWDLSDPENWHGVATTLGETGTIVRVATNPDNTAQTATIRQPWTVAAAAPPLHILEDTTAL